MDTPAEKPVSVSLSWNLTLLALLAVVTYLPTLTQPFFSDDFTNILFSRRYGGSSGWAALMADPASRVLLHVLNTWLVFALCSWRVVGRRVAPLAAGFFEVFEGNQEAASGIRL